MARRYKYRVIAKTLRARWFHRDAALTLTLEKMLFTMRINQTKHATKARAALHRGQIR